MSLEWMEIKDSLPWIIFTYECGVINAVRLEDLYKPSQKKLGSKAVDWCEFERCGYQDCNCKIADHNIQDQVTHPFWKLKHFTDPQINKIKDNRQSNYCSGEDGACVFHTIHEAGGE